MSSYELIDALCGVTTQLADIVRRQQAVIAQHRIEMEDPVLEEEIAETDRRLDEAERALRRR